MLTLDEVEEVDKVVASSIMQNQLVDDRSVHVLRRELIGVSVNHFGHTCEVTRDGCRIRLYDQVVVTDNIVEELAVVLQVGQQRCKLSLLALLHDQFEVILSQSAPLGLELKYGVYDALNVDL